MTTDITLVTCAKCSSVNSTVTPPEPVKVVPNPYYDKPLHIIDPKDCHKTLCGKSKTLGVWLAKDMTLGTEPTCPRCIAKITPPEELEEATARCPHEGARRLDDCLVCYPADDQPPWCACGHPDDDASWNLEDDGDGCPKGCASLRCWGRAWLRRKFPRTRQ